MEGFKMREEIRFLLAVLVVLLVILLAMKIEEVQALEREKEAHGWRQFSCRLLLDDPVTRRQLK